MSGNPNPQHNPTDGLGVAAYVHVSGSGVSANLTVGAGKPNPGNYKLTLSLTAAGGHAITCQLTAAMVDAADTAYSPVGSAVYVSYNDPAVDGDGDTAAWFNPSNFAGYDASVASVSSSGLITALALGEAIIEVQFPTFDNTLGNSASGAVDGGSPMQQNPINMIYTQIVVSVIP
jgi:hypothetical protein